MVRLRSPAPYGGFPERPKGADCKSVVTDFGGPNPPSPTKQKRHPFGCLFCLVGDGSSDHAFAVYGEGVVRSFSSKRCLLASISGEKKPRHSENPQKLKTNFEASNRVPLLFGLG